MADEKEVTIVGAGLSGLIAAIALAREGHKVTILEREARIGGLPVFRPDPAGSWFDVPALSRWTGVDLSPAVKLIDESNMYAYGKRYVMPMKSSIGMYMVERGSRSTSLDTHLMNEALALGVDIQYNQMLLTQSDFAKLPPDSIIATGLWQEAYDALNIPYEALYGWFAKGTVPHDRTTVSLWMDDFTKDYAFNCTVNGVCFALLFQRKAPLKKDGKKKYEELLFEKEGVELPGWDDLEGGCCPVGSIRNPRLFHGTKILSGTIAGVIDPFLFFGMLGALVSGKISAIAIEDKAKAYDLFRKATWTFYPGYVNKRVFNLVPHALRKPILQSALPFLPYVEDFAMKRIANFTPGWRVIQ
jgi:flavin-dependent dehydrogenase